MKAELKAEFEFAPRLNDKDWATGKPEIETGTIKMERYGEKGFLWYYNDNTTPYSTNENGNGLWSGTDQQKGTMQYHLPNHPKKAIRKVAKEFIQAQSNPGMGQIKKMKISGKI